MLILPLLSGCQNADHVPTDDYVARSTIPEPVIASKKVRGLFKALSIDKDFNQWYGEYTNQQERLDKLIYPNG